MVPFQRRVTWTSTARIQVVEAVMKVEEEIMKESNRGSRDPSGKEMMPKKWSRVASLLPREFQGQVWNTQSRKFVEYKCEKIFLDLLRIYREKLTGKNTKYSRRTIAVPLWELLKKRDDLLKGRTSIEAEKNLKLGRSNRVTAQWELLPTCNNVLGSIEANTRIWWTDSDRLLVIKAVIQVEQEDLRNKAGRPTRKWDRIAGLLPAELRARMNCQHLHSYGNKCRHMFVNTLRSYKELTQKGYSLVKGPQSPLSYQLSKPVFEMMKKREELRNPPIPIPAQSSSRSGSSKGFSTRTRSANDEQQLSTESTSFLKAHINQGHSSEDWCTGIATGTITRASEQPAASFLSQRTNGSTRAAEAVGFKTSAAEKEMNHVNYGESMEANIAGSSLGYTSRSLGELKDPNCHLTQDEDLIRRRIESEFSRLSSWVQSPAILQMTTSALRSCLMNKSNVQQFTEITELQPFDKVLQRSLSRKLEYRIHAAFQKLRAQFAEDLEIVSVELADEVLQDADLLDTFTRRG